MQQIKNLPFLRILIPFVCGILIQEYFLLSLRVVLIVLGFAIVGMVFCHFYSDKRIIITRKVILAQGVFIFIFSLGLGACLLENKNTSQRSHGLVENTKIVYTGVIDAYPEHQESNTRILIDVKNRADSGSVVNVTGKVFAFIEKSKKNNIIKPGDVIVFRTRLQQIKNDGNPYEFDFTKYFFRQGVSYFCFIDSGSFDIKGKGCEICLKRKAYYLRCRLAEVLEQNLEKAHVSIAQAMVLGLRDNVDEKITEGFVSAGIMHILAISGLHVGILFLFLGRAWYWVTFAADYRFGKAFFVLTCIWCYAFLTGFPPSVVRASLMLSLFLLGDVLNRQYGAVNSVFFAAFLLLFFDPNLLFNISFQLSFSAVLGILILYPLIVKHYSPKNTVVRYCWQIMVVSFSAQLGTLPVSLYYFHIFPTLFLFANVVAIPAAFVIVMGSIFMFLSSWLPVFPGLLGVVVNQCIEGLIYVTGFIDTLFFSRIEDLILTRFQSLLLYVIIFSLTAYLVFRFSAWLKVTILAIMFFLLVNIQSRFLNQDNDMILNTNDFLVLVLNRQQKVVILSEANLCVEESEDIAYYLSPYSDFRVEYRKTPSFTNQIIGFSTIGNQVSEPVFLSGKEEMSTERKYIRKILLMGEKPPQIEDIIDQIDFDIVILHPSIPYYFREKQKEVCRNLKIECHDLINEGAYVL